MAMRTILVPVEPYEDMRPVFEAAFRVAQRFGASVEGFAAHFPLESFAPGDDMIVPRIDPEGSDLERDAQRAFESFMAARRESRNDTVGEFTFGWRRDAPSSYTLVDSYGRTFDLTVIGRPSPDAAGPRMGMIEAALFESGRPVLIAPPDPPRQIGDTVVIAWNGSMETASMVALAMPLLGMAHRVVVLGVEGWGEPPSADLLTKALRQNGIPARTMIISTKSRSVGEAILARAASLGCDLLVKGAYTQSRLRLMIFGGATRHILTRTTMPVLMAH